MKNHELHPAGSQPFLEVNTNARTNGRCNRGGTKGIVITLKIAKQQKHTPIKLEHPLET